MALLGFVGLAALVPLTRAPIASLPRALMVAEMLLCPLTGVAAWLVWRRIDVGLDRKRAALRRWGWLLLVSALWPSLAPAIANPEFPALALLLCLALTAWTAFSFRKLQPNAALLMLPYLAWTIVTVTIVIVRF